MVHLIDRQPDGPSQSGFVRRVGHNLRLGTVVDYQLLGYKFQVLANRDGVQIIGVCPPIGKDGIEQLQIVLGRALRHYQHLATIPLGEPQTVLTEDEASVPVIEGEVIQ